MYLLGQMQTFKFFFLVVVLFLEVFRWTLGNYTVLSLGCNTTLDSCQHAEALV